MLIITYHALLKDAPLRSHSWQHARHQLLKKEESMTDYLPEVYQQFERRFPTVKEAFDALGAAEHDAGPLGERERRLIKLGIAVGAQSEGGVRSHVRKLLGIGVSEEEVLHTIVL